MASQHLLCHLYKALLYVHDIELVEIGVCMFFFHPTRPKHREIKMEKQKNKQTNKKTNKQTKKKTKTKQKKRSMHCPSPIEYLYTYISFTVHWNVLLINHWQTYCQLSNFLDSHRKIMPLRIEVACATQFHNVICQSGERRRSSMPNKGLDIVLATVSIVMDNALASSVKCDLVQAWLATMYTIKGLLTSAFPLITLADATVASSCTCHCYLKWHNFPV